MSATVVAFPSSSIDETTARELRRQVDDLYREMNQEHFRLLAELDERGLDPAQHTEAWLHVVDAVSYFFEARVALLRSKYPSPAAVGVIDGAVKELIPGYE